MSLQLWFPRHRKIHPPVNSDGSECEHWHVDCDRLDEEHQVAHGAAKHPAAWVEGVGEGKGHAGHAHEHVREGQVPNEEVGDVVHLAGSADDVEEQVVPKHTHRHNQHIEGDDERLERLQQGHICELGAAVGGVVLHRDLVNVAVCLHAASQATAIALHGSECTCAARNENSTGLRLLRQKTWITFLKVKAACQIDTASRWKQVVTLRKQSGAPLAHAHIFSLVGDKKHIIKWHEGIWMWIDARHNIVQPPLKCSYGKCQITGLFLQRTYRSLVPWSQTSSLEA